ncbi:MAG: hypothetical protein FWE97_03925 [Dehalococcoidia bacterium]|nr:hypothetical protein [Dehalococcoidia bacterium]
MSEQTEWYRNLEIGIDKFKAQLGADARDFFLERFAKIARRVDQFSVDCPQCREYQARMSSILQELSIDVSQITKEKKRNYLGNMNTMLSHLKKAHGLISDGQNTGIWLVLGIGIGAALGATFSNPAIGISAGLGLGLALGVCLDAQARKAGKVI